MSVTASSRERDRVVPRFILRQGFTPVLSFPSTVAVAGNLVDAARHDLGLLRLRPLMGGIGWVTPLDRRTTLQVNAVVGYSFNKADEFTDGARRGRLVVPERVADIDNSVAWEASAQVWHDLTPRVGVMTGLRFLRTRPELTFADGSRRRWTADTTTVEIGVAFTLFKKPEPNRRGAARGTPR